MKNALYYSVHPKREIKWTEVNLGSEENLTVPLMVTVASCCNTPIQHMNENKIGRQDYYLTYVLDGQLDVNTPQGRAVAREGDLIIIPPRSPYKIWCTGSNIGFLCVHFTGYDAEKCLLENGLSLFPQINKLHGSNHLSSRFKSLFDAFAYDDEFMQRELANLLQRIIIEAGRSKKKAMSSGLGLSKSIRYIHENYTQSIKIEDLAKIEAICLTLFNRKFKAETGTTPSKYIINLRMRMAIELLETSSLSIKEISAMVGYSNFNFFTRIFKSFTGKSPTQYRKGK